MLKVVFAVLLGLGLWTVSGNRVTADDEKEQQARPPRAVEAEKEQVEIEIKRVKRVKREADRPRESKEGGTRKRTLNQREAAIKELRVYLEKLKAQQRKIEKSDDAEARKKIAIQIRSTTAKLEDLQASFRNEGIERKERRGEREEHPEIRAARNQLEHMRAAIKHLKEAGLKEYAQAVGQRAEKLQATIHRSLDRGREGDERRRDQDVARKGERPQRDSDRKEVRRDVKRERSPRREGAGNPERELNQAILQIRKELEELRKEVRRLRGERGERREGSEDRGERDDG